MYKVIAKNFSKNNNQHSLDLEIYDGENLIKEKNYSCKL